MPTYEFLCTECGEIFTRIMSLKEHEKSKPACPKCNSQQVKQQIAHFMTKTSRKS